MITHFLGKEQVNAYCKDFAKRLQDLGENFPRVWCPIGFSGLELYNIVVSFLPNELRATTVIQPLIYQKPNNGNKRGEIGFAIAQSEIQTESDALSDLKDLLKESSTTVLVLDSSVYSGSSMLSSVRFLEKLEPAAVLTYSLIVKQRAGYIPHYFGLVVGDHDRALFLLDSIPNNRLAKPQLLPTGILREISADDVNMLDKLDTGVDSISKIGWGDLWYDMHAHDFQIYIIEIKTKLVGYVKYRFHTSTQSLMLDVIAVDREFHGKGAGAALFRWVETTARSSSCRYIELWGYAPEVAKYKSAGYQESGKWIDTGNGEKYQLMCKPLLYHFDLNKLNTD